MPPWLLVPSYASTIFQLSGDISQNPSNQPDKCNHVSPCYPVPGSVPHTRGRNSRHRRRSALPNSASVTLDPTRGDTLVPRQCWGKRWGLPRPRNSGIRLEISPPLFPYSCHGSFSGYWRSSVRSLCGGIVTSWSPFCLPAHGQSVGAAYRPVGAD